MNLLGRRITKNKEYYDALSANSAFKIIEETVQSSPMVAKEDDVMVPEGVTEEIVHTLVEV